MAFHHRASWGARPSARPLLPFASVAGVAIHWNGPPIARTQRPIDVVRSTQAFHMGPQRGWRDIAYNLAVDWNGDVWEGRGLEYRNGAHDNDQANDHYVAIEVMTGEGQAITASMIAGVRDAIALTRARWPQATGVTPHSRWTATACPGDELRRLIADGTFTAPPAPSPNVPQLPQEDDVYWLYLLHPAAINAGEPRDWVVAGGRKFACPDSGYLDKLRAAGAKTIDLSADESASRTFRNGHP